MSGHTPGPWECRPIGMYPTEILIYLPGDRPYSQNPIAKTFGRVHAEDGIRATEHRLIAQRQHRIDEAMANARLIAAAPELLALAQKWAAIDGGSWHPVRYAREKADLLTETAAAIAKATGAHV